MGKGEMKEEEEKEVGDEVEGGERGRGVIT